MCERQKIENRRKSNIVKCFVKMALIEFQITF
jgi:hypothetical protein